MGADFQKYPAKPRKSMKKRASSPFFWSRKRESNPPGSAWEADAIPLGDSCIFGCISFASRFHGNGSTFAQLRFASRARWLALAPRTGSAWEADAKNRVPTKILRSKRFGGKGGAGIEALPRRRRGGKVCLAPTRRFLHIWLCGGSRGRGLTCLAPTRRSLHIRFGYMSIIAEKGRAVKRKKCGMRRIFRVF